MLETAKQSIGRAHNTKARAKRHQLVRSSEKTLHEQIADQMRSEVSSRLRTGD